MKYLILLLLVLHTWSSLRFADEQMMKKHHNHTNKLNDTTLTIHLIPHSHDDVGWLKTVDNYFYGGDQQTQWAGVQYTIDTVVQQLSQNQNYKFSIVEIAFLYRWWNGASQDQKAKLTKLVQNKQIQFINAGWSMSDQANPYYEDWIDQMTIGLRWIQDTFNYIPSVAWHIDPFGHQSSSASMFSRMGFQSFFFARIDYQDKQVRLANKALQMIWHPLQYTQDPTTYIFTHVNYYHYSSPPGFCFDLKCNDEPIKDDLTLEDYNLDVKSKQLVDYFKSMALHFQSSHLLHTLGEDFQYGNARMFFKNIDKLMNYINSHPQYGVTLIYSTPGIYIDAIHKESNTYPSKNDDFFPYADNQHAYWTGYFTSRVAVKGFVRDFSRWIQAVRKHISEIKISGVSTYIKSHANDIQSAIWGMEMAQGILQHHDAVAGTEKQKVADDYILTALKSIEQFNTVYRSIKVEEINNQIGEKITQADLHMNIYWNETSDITGVSSKLNSNKTVLVNIYNPGSKGTYEIKINVPPHELKIIASKNVQVKGDVLCDNLYATDNCQLVFYYDLEEASTNYFKLIPVKNEGSAKIIKLKQILITQSIKTFQLTETEILNITRASKKLVLKIGNNINPFTIAYNYYQSYQGQGQKSGAYIFRPQGNNEKQFSNIKTIHYAQGTTMVVIFLDGDKTQTKVYFSKEKNYLKNYGFQIQTEIHSIPITDKIGKEITMNFQTNFQNNKTFYTDSNGLEQQKRIIDFRPTWDLVVNQPIAGNFYPVNSHIVIQDTTSQNKLAILTDRSQGASSINDGQIQIMIHRRCLYDDARGVDQPLNEVDSKGQGLVQSVRHYVVFGSQYRQVQKRKDQKLVYIFSSTATNTIQSNPRSPPITVPQMVKLYLRPFTDDSYLMRLHNMDPFNENSVTLSDDWVVTQYTLSANQLLSDWKNKQYKWNNKSTKESTKEQPSFLMKIYNFFKNIFSGIKGWIHKKTEPNDNNNNNNNGSILLKKFEIKTFKITKK